ncbi:Hypp5910 [Branchiostoma lanceolatum]|uniref:Hypp5910 protein n=1 Tax=Branchiostoma lanceolatum TaxID=7740 RepID=A0A8J9YPD3_BRALA|nr:Hypp5910 [Branchiostoma lanceolatum]
MVGGESGGHELQAFSILQHVKKEYRCGDCSFCIDYDLMVQVLRHHFNCTSAKYVNILSQGITQHHGHSYGDVVPSQPTTAQSEAKVPDAHEREQTITIHHHPATSIQKSPSRPSSLNATNSLAGSDASFSHPGVMLSAEDHTTSQVQQASSVANRQTMMQESHRHSESAQTHVGVVPHHTQSPPSPSPVQRRLSASSALQWTAVSSPDPLKWGGGLYVKQEPSELSGVMTGDHMHTPHSQQSFTMG